MFDLGIVLLRFPSTLDLLHSFFERVGYMTCENNFIPENSIRKAAEKIHEAGGCDGTDEYSRGYDDAVTLALNILL